MSMHSKASEALVTGFYKSLTFLKSAKGPNYRPVRCVPHHRTKQPLNDPPEELVSSMADQIDDADFNAAQCSPEGKLSLPPGTCWQCLAGERPGHRCGDTRRFSILVLALLSAMLELTSLAQFV